MKPFLKPIVAALALALACATAFAGEPLSARLVLRNPEAYFPTPTTPDLRVLRVIDPATDADRMVVFTDGTVSFAPGATVNFPSLHFQAGRFAGFVVVRAMGAPYLMPIFEPLPGELGPEWAAPAAEPR